MAVVLAAAVVTYGRVRAVALAPHRQLAGEAPDGTRTAVVVWLGC
ncbi:hypothetical protein [Streptomyces sp. NPDC048392]